MRADRLVVDDVRGAELWDVLGERAAHPTGALVGVHASGSGPAELVRLARLGCRAGGEVAADLVAHTIRVVLELERDAEGQPRVVRIAELTGTTKKGDVEAHDLFLYDGGFNATGASASFRA
jgi:Flp pilus assembly CpaF family ATPase